VYLPGLDEVFVTSNQFKRSASDPVSVDISKLSRQNNGSWVGTKLDCDIVMPNGAVNYESGILFCAQGNHQHRSGLVFMESTYPYKTSYILDNYHGRRFNSPNDVVVKSDGTIWFSDPIYGFEQGFCPTPQLPCQVYRFDPKVGDVRVVADGLGRPNGLAFSSDEQTVYITDTDWAHGDGTTDDCRVSTMYVVFPQYHCLPWFVN
jgi:gluconolactonase